jgi:hypothetical protein
MSVTALMPPLHRAYGKVGKVVGWQPQGDDKSHRFYGGEDEWTMVIRSYRTYLICDLAGSLFV